MQLVEGDLFARFPALRLVIPHGGGAVPYHWGRSGAGRPAGQARAAPPRADQRLLRHLRLPPGRHRPAAPGDPGGQHPVRLGDVGAVRGIDPETGFPWDDTKRYVDAAGLSAVDRTKIFETNALRVYPRLAARLAAGA